MATKVDIARILGGEQDDGRLKIAKTKIVCTLGPKSREVPVLEKLLKAGMNVARFNFSHGTHEYQQYTLDNLRQAMSNTEILCAVLLDTKVCNDTNFIYSFILQTNDVAWKFFFLVCLLTLIGRRPYLASCFFSSPFRSSYG